MSDLARDSLDEAIDRVANRLVSVQDRLDVAQRIVESLPPRRSRGWWDLASLPLRAAAIAAVALAIVYVRASKPVDLVPPEDRRPAVASRAPAASQPETLPAVEPPPIVTQAASRRPRVDRRAVEVQPGFGIAAIEGPEALSVTALAADIPLEAPRAAELAPISIDDLPLTGEAQLPFFKE